MGDADWKRQMSIRLAGWEICAAKLQKGKSAVFWAVPVRVVAGWVQPLGGIGGEKGRKIGVTEPELMIKISLERHL